MADIAPVPDGQGNSPAPAPVAPPVPAPAPAPAAAIPWLPGADDLTTGYVQNKGWTEPTDVIQAYKNAEKFISAPMDKRLVIPNDNQDPKAWDDFYAKLGRPSEPAGYKLTVPEGAPKEFATAAAAKMHELGISQAAGEKLGAWWNEQATATQTAHTTQTQQAIQADEVALKGAWGAAHAQNLVIAQAGARGLGVDADTVTKLESVMGYKRTMEFFHDIGSKMGEPGFVTGDKAQGFGAALTPAQAQDQIRAKMQDKDFVAKYLNGNAEAKAEMKRLHEFAHPEG